MVNMPDPSRLVKVSFRLDPERVGFRGEHLWAERVGSNRFRLLNIPFHAPGFGYHDVVFAKRRRTGELYVTGVSLRSGHSTFWIVVADGAGEAFPRWWARLKALGCGYESTGHVYATDVPPETSLDHVYAILDAGEAAGVWTFEEAHRGHLTAGVDGTAER
ncbi:MAG TPA: DUF4265 domain-containing protein [Anaeromyxobacteraceae bacterium]|nr:DUF4265 domain-containing protein [Anaeromyxobacteraceae bacterium]